MDDDLLASPSRQSSTGGAVEPGRRAPTGDLPHGSSERFELRDRATGVVHQAATFPEMAAKAEQLGSTLFVAVAADGKRTSIEKVGGQWQRGPQRPASTAAPAALVRPVEPAREGADAAAAPPAPAAPAEPEDARERTRLEAKAERAQLVARLEAALAERYIVQPAPASIGALSIGRTEYRFRGDSSRVAFSESTLRLATDTNSPSVARSMVDVAQMRGWRGLRVSGHQEFKRQVWLEASARGLKALGYEPGPQDLALLQREREARLVNRIEPGSDSATTPTEKDSARGGAWRNSVLAAVEALLVAQKVPEGQRIAVMQAATERLAQLSSQGLTPRVKIYDPAAPSRAPAMPTPVMQRTPERVEPSR